ncbi:MAG: TetR/AcrR family transcriptional regulator [Lachnospiraceae bacterium]|nr:TetR/AcrR family transcriptional regulator [Lachnospiraceae bacterium]MBO5146933.1 TetR/AcrR family transcriptional regulator [Lachnospiraceae bacterium]
MDLRIERTRRSIINAFIELRSRKPLEKITVKELAELAFINKATFYSHYKDIYDLSEQLENETIDMILANIPHPEELLTKPKPFVEILSAAFTSQNSLLEILFSGSRTHVFINKVEERMKHQIFSIYPEYKDSLEWDILLSFLIQGGFRAFLSHSNEVDNAYLIDIVGTINERILK